MVALRVPRPSPGVSSELRRAASAAMKRGGEVGSKRVRATYDGESDVLILRVFSAPYSRGILAAEAGLNFADGELAARITFFAFSDHRDSRRAAALLDVAWRMAASRDIVPAVHGVYPIRLSAALEGFSQRDLEVIRTALAHVEDVQSGLSPLSASSVYPTINNVVGVVDGYVLWLARPSELPDWFLSFTGDLDYQVASFYYDGDLAKALPVGIAWRGARLWRRAGYMVSAFVDGNLVGHEIAVARRLELATHTVSDEAVAIPLSRATMVLRRGGARNVVSEEGVVVCG